MHDYTYDIQLVIYHDLSPPIKKLIESTQEPQGAFFWTIPGIHDIKSYPQFFVAVNPTLAAKKYHVLQDLTHDTCLPRYINPTVHVLIHHLFISVLTPVLTMFCGFVCCFNCWWLHSIWNMPTWHMDQEKAPKFYTIFFQCQKVIEPAPLHGRRPGTALRTGSQTSLSLLDMLETGDQIYFVCCEKNPLKNIQV